jgi:hypothetical protein
MASNDSISIYTESLILPAAILTHIYFWSFLVQTGVWIYKLRSINGTIKDKLELSTAISLICFTMVLLL